MKPYVSSFLLAAALTGAASAQSPTNFQYGLTLGPTGSGTEITPFTFTSGGISTHGVQHSAYTGGLVFYSAQEELSRGNLDGGVTTYGNPVNIVLGSDNDPVNNDRGVFGIWKSSKWISGSPSDKALFSISSPSQVATFEDVDVVINDGTLTVSGSPALTQATSTSYLSGQGFLQTSGLSTALAGLTPPTSSSWTNTYVPRGTVSNGATLALGSSVASGYFSIAGGSSSFTVASGTNSQAYGASAVASGAYSYANGSTTTAEGLFSIAHGLQLTAKSASETVFEKSPSSGRLMTCRSASDRERLMDSSDPTAPASRA